ncbi:MAG: hypothetical protein J6K21_01635, partial [Bacilli bacterium]|nr:hypothetical protein [Bacilli bacterium]
INILENKTVGSAMLCINGYVAEYLNNDVSIVSDDCSEMENIIEYIVDKEGYQVSRTLTINYPKGNYEYYYKVSGKAKIGEDIVEKDKEIKTTNNISILLEENQTIETWMIKNGKKISLRKYIEEEIDNVEIGVPTSVLNVNIPEINQLGIESPKNQYSLNITFENQDGTFAEYSIDYGKSWIKYTGETVVPTIDVKTRLVRFSGRTGKIVSANISKTSLTAVPESGYDKNYENGFNCAGCYLKVSNNMINRNINVKWYNYNAKYETIYFEFLDENKTSIEKHSNTTSRTTIDEEFTIPNNTKYIYFYANSGYTKIYEIEVSNKPIINGSNPKYPILTENGIKTYDTEISIKYFDTSVKKIYSLNKTDWNEYKDGLKIEVGQTIYAKGIDENDKETEIREFSYVLPKDALPFTAFDGNDDTYASNGKYYIDVDNKSIGKKLKLKWYNYDARYETIYFEFLDENKTTIEKYSNTTSRTIIDEEFTIPNNTKYILFYGGSGYTQFREVSITN